MFVNYRTQGLVLKKVDRGEADQLLTIYSKDFGKLEILGKAIRKISSKLRAGAEIFYLSEIEFIQAKAHKTLTDARAINKFENIRSDLKRLKIAHKIAETLDELVKGQEKDENLWQLLQEVFRKLNNCQIVKLSNCQLLFYFFLWNLFSILGYEPQLYHCVLCQKKLEPQRIFFDSKEGGLICNQCQKSVKSIKPSSKKEFLLPGREVSPETIKILRLLLKKDWSLFSKLKIEKSDLESLDEISDEFYSYIRKFVVV